MSNYEPLDLSKITKHEFPMIKQLSYEQEDMVTKLLRTRRLLVDAVAGSGKTTVLTQAMKVLKDKDRVSRVYYVVFPVQEGSLGFLPGELPSKLAPYAVPFIQALIKAGVHYSELDPEVICNPLIEGDYKVVPHTFLRGQTWDGIGVIIDESQNGTLDELQKTFTRLEDDCYIAIAGHNGQIDIEKSKSGFSTYIHHFKRGVETGVYTEIEFASLTHNFRGKFSAFVDQVKNFAEEEQKQV